MYVETVPNRNSPPAILLREAAREGKRVRKRTLANLTHWPAAKVKALRALLRDEPLVSPRACFSITRSLPHGHRRGGLGDDPSAGVRWADRLEAPVSTVKNRLLAARRKLKERMMNMVEDELKKSRPGKKFSERVLRRVSQVRVWIKKGVESGVLLTDSRKRSFPILIGAFEGESLEPWLAGKGSPEAKDIHTALVRALRAFGCRIKELRIDEMKDSTEGIGGSRQVYYCATLVLRAGRASREIDCRPSDGINLAVRAGAPVFVDETIIEPQSMKDDTGAPLSPEAAWELFQVQSKPGSQPSAQSVPLIAPDAFANVDEALAALEANPQSSHARVALAEIRPAFQMRPSRIKDLSDGMAKFEAWAKRKQGTEHEGLALGLWGALLLFGFPPGEPPEVISLLERARALLPADRLIAHDLATAYVMAGRLDDALDIIEKERLERVDRWANFQKLWRNRRFRAAAGWAKSFTPDPAVARSFMVAGLGLGTPFPRPARMGMRPMAPGKTVVTVTPAPGAPPSPFAAPPQWPVHVPRIDAEEARRLTQELDLGTLVSVDSVSPLAFPGESGQAPPAPAVRPVAEYSFVLKSADNRSLDLPATALDHGLLAGGLVQAARPLTARIVCDILKSAEIAVEAAALAKSGRAGTEGVLVLSAGNRREAVKTTGPAALAVALAATCPILVAERLMGREKARRRVKA